MVLVAGLPKGVDQHVLAKLRHQFRGEFRFCVTTFEKDDQNLYTGPGLGLLFRAGFAFIARSLRPPDPAQYAPETVYLLYVPSPYRDRLLQFFEFFVFPSPVPLGLKERHERDAAARSFIEAVKALRSLDPTRSLVRKQVQQQANTTHLLLPPRNFHCRKVEAQTVFREMQRGEREYRKFPEKRKAYGTSKQKAFFDRRKLVFPPEKCPHPPASYPGADSEDWEQKLVLNRLYRFGFRYRDGHHYDVQRPNGDPLKKVTLYSAADRTAVERSGTHVNIYPCDTIR